MKRLTLREWIALWTEFACPSCHLAAPEAGEVEVEDAPEPEKRKRKAKADVEVVESGGENE